MLESTDPAERYQSEPTEIETPTRGHEGHSADASEEALKYWSDPEPSDVDNNQPGNLTEATVVTDYETMAPKDLMNRVEQLTGPDVLNANSVLAFRALNERITSFDSEDAKRANQLKTAVLEWQKELKASYQPGQPVPEGPKNLAEYISKVQS